MNCESPLLLVAVVVIVACRLTWAVVDRFVVIVVESVVDVVSILTTFVDWSKFGALAAVGCRVERAEVFVWFHSLRNVVIIKVSVQC